MSYFDKCTSCSKEITRCKTGMCQPCGARLRMTTHGKRYIPEYAIWQSMIQRCVHESHSSYKNYGGRGISVETIWEDFEVFYSDMGPRPSSSHEIDRIDNSGDYGPSNCKWVTRDENANNRRNNRKIEFDGVTMGLSEWARETGINRETIAGRINLGWSVEDALTTPVRRSKDV